MMTGKLYIDGYDAFTTYGVYIINDGYKDLVALPPLKTPTTNDWQEEDGVEVDLSAPVLDTKEVSVKFALSGLYSRYFDFFALLSDKAYHTFECVEIERTFRLRMVQMSSLDAAKQLGFFTVKFNDDFPTEFGEDFIDFEPYSELPESTEYMLDDRMFSSFDIRILEGSLSEILKQPQVKENLLRNIATKNGVIYDDAIVTYKSKDVKLTCLARGHDLATLWHNLDCLLYFLTRPGEHTLGVEAVDGEFPFYYKESAVTEFESDREPWLKFTLTLVFTGSLRLNDDDFVLASEEGAIIVTEEDDEEAIEMRPDN